MPTCILCSRVGGRRVRRNGLDVWICTPCLIKRRPDDSEDEK